MEKCFHIIALFYEFEIVALYSLMYLKHSEEGAASIHASMK